MLTARAVGNWLRKSVLIGTFIIITGAAYIFGSQRLEPKSYLPVDRIDFAVGQPMMFNWTFTCGEEYKFEVEGVGWTGQPRHRIQLHYKGKIIYQRLDHSTAPGVFIIDPHYYRWWWPSNPPEETHVFGVSFAYSANVTRSDVHVDIYQEIDLVNKPYEPFLYIGAPLVAIGIAVTVLGIRKYKQPRSRH